MDRNAPIGIFDSGMGGLSVWREVHRLLPNESIVYLADGKNCPYGDKDPAEIEALTDAAVQQLMRRGVKLIVIACNTATAVAIDSLRGRYPIEFVGLEPAVKPAALSTRSGTIAILATHASLEGGLFKATASKYSDNVRILSAAGEGFVEAVEQGRESEPETLELVRASLEPMLAEGADRVVLGCTHYPFLLEAMQRVAGERDVEFIDPSQAVARRVEWLLERDNLRADRVGEGECEFVTFADDNYLRCIRQKAGVER